MIEDLNIDEHGGGGDLGADPAERDDISEVWSDRSLSPRLSGNESDSDWYSLAPLAITSEEHDGKVERDGGAPTSEDHVATEVEADQKVSGENASSTEHN